jgi:hypothetical protein
MYVPDLKGSLLSVPSLAKLGYQIMFEEESCSIYRGKLLVVAAKLNDVGLYQLKNVDKTLNVRGIEKKIKSNLIGKKYFGYANNCHEAKVEDHLRWTRGDSMIRNFTLVSSR